MGESLVEAHQITLRQAILSPARTSQTDQLLMLVYLAYFRYLMLRVDVADFHRIKQRVTCFVNQNFIWLTKV
jgi:hypothetical protein